MKVLITGGAGFIGSHLADRLLERGDSILVVDNFATARRDNLTPHKNLRVVEGTIADAALVDGLFREFRPDKVVHAAASYKDPNNWAEDSRTNVLGSAHVSAAAKAYGVRRLIYLQTSLCYGLQPLEQPITLKHPLFSGGYSGGSSYAITKTAGEQFIELSGLDFISFRLANAYGPRNLSGPLPTFYHRLANQLPCFVMDTRRDFIYVADLVEVLLKALDGTGERGFYHVSSGSDYAIKELYDGVVAALGSRPEEEVEVRPRGADDVYTILIEPGKTNRDFGWKATTPLEAGIREAVAWYKTHGITATYTHLKVGEEKK
ncbi:MAG: NAD-dependent epimerase/dehydratase family protein [Deltaproteobacteria bacterium]|jgi:UDP-glucose 4-epimerase|nr:MAG: NAD-dependent epimerase/dehydratase family protein [Deltaproteobacteria bacterium]